MCTLQLVQAVGASSWCRELVQAVGAGPVRRTLYLKQSCVLCFILSLTMGRTGYDRKENRILLSHQEGKGKVDQESTKIGNMRVPQSYDYDDSIINIYETPRITTTVGVSHAYTERSNNLPVSDPTLRWLKVSYARNEKKRVCNLLLTQTTTPTLRP